MRNKKYLACLVALLFGATAVANAETVVIVNPKNPANALTAEQVAAIYLGNAQQFPEGGTIALADQPDTAPVRAEFYEKATGRTAAQVKAVWARIVFTGKGTPPKELKTDADVKAFVASRPDAIGYVQASAVDSSVKPVLKL